MRGLSVERISHKQMHRCSSHSEVTLSKEFLAAVLAAILFGLPLRHWVNTDRQQSSSVKVAPASFGERHIRILAQRHQLLFAIYAVLPITPSSSPAYPPTRSTANKSSPNSAAPRPSANLAPNGYPSSRFAVVPFKPRYSGCPVFRSTARSSTS